MKGGFKPGLAVSILLHLERVQQYNSITFRDEQLPDKKFLRTLFIGPTFHLVSLISLFRFYWWYRKALQ